MADRAARATPATLVIVFGSRRAHEDLWVVFERAEGRLPVVLVQEHLEQLALVQVEQVAEDLEQTVQMVDLLLHVDKSVMLVTLILLMCFSCLLILRFDFNENFLQLVEILTLPGLQLRMVTL